MPLPRWLLVLALVLSSAPTARAGTALRLHVDGLVRGSSAVFEGRVVAARGVELAGRIATEYQVEVERDFRGQGPPLRTIRVPGGVLPDGRGLLLPGLAPPAVGERRLFFLGAPDARGLRMPVGLSQGWLRVLETPGGGRWIATPPGAASLADPASGSVQPAPTELRSYAALVAEIRAALARAELAGTGGPR